MSKEEQAKKLIAKIKKARNASEKYQAIDELGNIGRRAKQAVSLLINLVKDASESFNIRSKAIWSLGEISSGAAVKPLIDVMLSDDNKYIRILSLESLGKICKRPELAIPTLQKTIHSEPLSEVRNRIPKILSKFGHEAIPILFDFIEALDVDTRYNSFLALGEIEDENKTIVPFLKEKLEHVSGSDKVGCALALLLQEGTESEAKSLLEQLKSEGTMTLGQQTMFNVILEKGETKSQKVLKKKTTPSDLSLSALKRINKIIHEKEFEDTDFPIKNYSELIKEKETGQIEFKSALRFNKGKQKVLKELETNIIRTVVGFMNTKGGILLIGVNNNGDIIGLDGDYRSLGKGKQDSDGFRLRLNELYSSFGIKVQAINYVESFIEEIKNKEICIVSVDPADKPVLLKNKQNLIVRLDNSTRSLSPKEAYDYILKRFGSNSSS